MGYCLAICVVILYVCYSLLDCVIICYWLWFVAAFVVGWRCLGFCFTGLCLWILLIYDFVGLCNVTTMCLRGLVLVCGVHVSVCCWVVVILWFGCYMLVVFWFGVVWCWFGLLAWSLFGGWLFAGICCLVGGLHWFSGLPVFGSYNITGGVIGVVYVDCGLC